MCIKLYLWLNIHYTLHYSCWGPCYSLQVESEWIKSEDLGVIIADRGMIEDHMPTRVMEVLHTHHRDVSTLTALVFTKNIVEEERERVRQQDIRDQIQNRVLYEQPIRRGSICSDGRGKGDDEPDFGGEDEVDGTVKEADDANKDEEETVFDATDRGSCEDTTASEEDEIHSVQPEREPMLERSTAIDIEGDEDCAFVDQQNGFIAPEGIIASDGRVGPEETEMEVEMYGSGYTELSPAHNTASLKNT